MTKTYKNTMAIFLLLFMIATMILPSTVSSQNSKDSQSYIIIKKPQNPSPNVSFPTGSQLTEYYNNQSSSQNNIFFNLFNSTQKSSDLRGVAEGNNTYIAWLTPINKTTNVFLTMSHDHGQNFSIPKQMNDPKNGNASNLQLTLAGRSNMQNISVGLVWQEIQGNKSNVIASTSMDLGDNFKTFMLNRNNTYATDPIIIGNGDNLQFAWFEQNISFGNTTNPISVFSHCCSW